MTDTDAENSSWERLSRKDAEFFWVVSASKFLSCNLQFNLFLRSSFDCIPLLSYFPPTAHSLLCSCPVMIAQEANSASQLYCSSSPIPLPRKKAFCLVPAEPPALVSDAWTYVQEYFLCCTCMWHSWLPWLVLTLGKCRRTWLLWDFHKPSLHWWSARSFTYMGLCSAFACRLARVSKDGPGKKRTGKP